MRIFFTKHARLRLAERGTKEITVRQVLVNPDLVCLAYDDKLIYRKRIGGKNIEVVCVKSGDKYFVITVYYV